MHQSVLAGETRLTAQFAIAGPALVEADQV